MYIEYVRVHAPGTCWVRAPSRGGLGTRLLHKSRQRSIQVCSKLARSNVHASVRYCVDGELCMRPLFFWLGALITAVDHAGMRRNFQFPVVISMMDHLITTCVIIFWWGVVYVGPIYLQFNTMFFLGNSIIFPLFWQHDFYLYVHKLPDFFWKHSIFPLIPTKIFIDRKPIKLAEYQSVK